MSPHFSFQHGYPVIDSGSAPGSFYIHFVQWLRTKTGVMTYRIIHKRNTVNVLSSNLMRRMFNWHRLLSVVNTTFQGSKDRRQLLTGQQIICF